MKSPDRREVLSLSVAAPMLLAGGDVAIPRVTRSPRVLIVAQCRPAHWTEEPNRDWQTAKDYAKTQESLGRRVVAVLERAVELAMVVIEIDCSTETHARYEAQRIFEQIQMGPHDYGDVYAIASLAADECIDVWSFIIAAKDQNRDSTRVAALTRRVQNLEEQMLR